MEDDFTDHEATDYADYTDYGVFPSRGRRAFTPAWPGFAGPSA